MTDKPVTIESLSDIESVLSNILQRLYGIYDARSPHDDPKKPDPVWERIDSLYEYVHTVDDDVHRTHFLQTIQELP